MIWLYIDLPGLEEDWLDRAILRSRRLAEAADLPASSPISLDTSRWSWANWMALRWLPSAVCVLLRLQYARPYRKQSE